MSDIIDSILSPEDKAAIVADRQRAWAADLYGHTLNRDAQVAAGGKADPDTLAAIDTLTAALQGLAPVKAALGEVIAARSSATAEIASPLEKPARVE